MRGSRRSNVRKRASHGIVINLGLGATAMKLLNIFKSFKNDESGAVTVDWVVLTAAIVGLGMVVMTTVGGGIEGLGYGHRVGSGRPRSWLRKPVIRSTSSIRKGRAICAALSCCGPTRPGFATGN